jgi:type VI secretion system protein ImpA
VLLRPRESGRVVGEYSYLDWVQPARKPEFEEAIARANAEEIQRFYAEACEAREALRELAAALDARLGEASPDVLSPEHPTNIGNALENCINLLEEIMRRRGLDGSANGQPAAPTAAAPAADGAVATPTLAPGAGRDALYRQIEQIADALGRTEPHSPIPYLLKRCVRLGRLPFPELMRAMIRETATLDELDRLLGLGSTPSEEG